MKKKQGLTFFNPGIVAESAMNLSAISCLLFLSDIMWPCISHELLTLFYFPCVVAWGTELEQCPIIVGCLWLKQLSVPFIAYRY